MPISPISIKVFVLHKDWKYFDGTIVIFQTLGLQPFLYQREPHKFIKRMNLIVTLLWQRGEDLATIRCCCLSIFHNHNQSIISTLVLNPSDFDFENTN